MDGAEDTARAIVIAQEERLLLGHVGSDGLRHPGFAESHSRDSNDRDYYDSGRDAAVPIDAVLPSSAYSNKDASTHSFERTFEEKDLIWLWAIPVVLVACCLLSALFACRRRGRIARRVGGNISSIPSNLGEIESQKKAEEVVRTERLTTALNATSMTVEDCHLIEKPRLGSGDEVEEDIEMGFEPSAAHEITSGQGEDDIAVSTSGTLTASDSSPYTRRNELESSNAAIHDGENSDSSTATKQYPCNFSECESADYLPKAYADQQDTCNDDEDKQDNVLCLPCSATSSFEANAGESTPRRLVPATCAICLTKYSPGCHVAWSCNPECTHAFHKECMLMWLLKNEASVCPSWIQHSCPCCRRAFVLDSSPDEVDGVDGC